MDLSSFAGPFLPEIVLLAGTLLIFLLDVLGVRRIETTGAVAVGATALALLFVVADLGLGPLSALATIPSGQIDTLVAPGRLLSTRSLRSGSSSRGSSCSPRSSSRSPR